jgi:hypothetical protein
MGIDIGIGESDIISHVLNDMISHCIRLSKARTIVHQHLRARSGAIMHRIAI